MLLVIILVLRCLSWAVGFTSTGVYSLVKMNSRLNESEGSSGEDVTNYLKPLNALKWLIDIIRYMFSAVLPIVLVLDVVVFLLFLSVAGSTNLLFSDDIVGTSTPVVADESNNLEGKSKILLIGDSRTAQLGINVFDMPYANESGPAGVTATVIGETSSGDYIFSKGSESLEWVKQVESDIDAQVDSNTAVVMNMGTNGLGAEQYIDYMNDKYEDWTAKGASVYFCTTNPVLDEEASNWTTLTDSQVVEFNKEVKEGLDSNIGWIDTYSEVYDMVVVDKMTPKGDGVHYDKEVYEKIWEVICDSVKSSEDSSDSTSDSNVSDSDVSDSDSSEISSD